MNISSIHQDDFASVLALNAAAVPHVNLIGEIELQWFVDNAACTNVMKIDGRIAGFMIGLRPGTDYQSLNYRWFASNYEDFAYVDRVVVDKWARRQGVAEALYREFSRTQSDAQFMTCEVNIRPANEGSMRFHTNMGFRQVAAQEVENGAKEVALMEMKL